MSNLARRAVYNPRITLVLMQLLRLLRAAGFLILAALLLDMPAAQAADWTAPEAQLAAKIAAVTGPGAVTLDIANHSSLTRAEFTEINRGLRSALEASGLQFVGPDQAAATVQIFLSEDLQNYVWLAQIHQGTNPVSVVMVSVPRSGAMVAPRDNEGVTIHKALLWSQPDPILDVAVVDVYPANMIVLDDHQVSLYKQEGNHWQLEQSLAVAHLHAWPRDLRGRLVLRKDHLFDAYLPGVFCRSTAVPPLALNCFESDDPWPLAASQFNLSAFYSSARNYFTGALAPGIGGQKSVISFYSAAPLPRDKYTLWILAGVDGQIHLLDGISDQHAGKLDWGGDIASVNTGCGSGWDVLATGNGDGPEDSVRAFEAGDREPVAVSAPVEFQGRITALWTEASGTNAVAIMQDGERRNYEAYRLSFACGQ